ncbi:thioesterase-like superfamily-domain-containing protein [Mariannaea sp. PMI_226]|nr:thioesterase-like superfamily-domain-containing protein [Mariannaea sp. PMI_226]
MANLIRFNQSVRCVAVPAAFSIAPGAKSTSRQFHTTRPVQKNHANNPRWLSEAKQRLVRFQELGAPPLQTQKAKDLSKYLESHWLELLAGGEGFLTGKEWRGLDQHHVAWGDMDSMGHVNNVMYNKYAESGRVNWLRNFARTASPEHQKEWVELMTPRSVGLILRSIKTDYKFPMDYPDRTTVVHKLLSPPGPDSDHILLEAAIISERHQRAAARCFEDIVVFDYRVAKKTPLKKFMLDEFKKTYQKQETSRRKCIDEINNLFKEIEELEASSKS